MTTKNLQTDTLRILLRERQNGTFISNSTMGSRISKIAAKKARQQTPLQTRIKAE